MLLFYFLFWRIRRALSARDADRLCEDILTARVPSVHVWVGRVLAVRTGSLIVTPPNFATMAPKKRARTAAVAASASSSSQPVDVAAPKLMLRGGVPHVRGAPLRGPERGWTRGEAGGAPVGAAHARLLLAARGVGAHAAVRGDAQRDAPLARLDRGAAEATLPRRGAGPAVGVGGAGD